MNLRTTIYLHVPKHTSKILCLNLKDLRAQEYVEKLEADTDPKGKRPKQMPRVKFQKAKKQVNRHETQQKEKVEEQGEEHIACWDGATFG